jgi:hypothetical protein
VLAIHVGIPDTILVHSRIDFMDHLSLPIDFTARTAPAGVRVIPSDVARKCQNITDGVMSTGNSSLHAAHQAEHVSRYVSSNIATINRELANEGAALVLAMIARAGGRA